MSVALCHCANLGAIGQIIAKISWFLDFLKMVAAIILDF